MTYSQKRERSKYRNHKVRLCVLCVCEGFCITPTSSYAMLKHQLTLHNFLLFIPKPDEMKENREIYTEEG